ncbi:hypothetical protein DPMN_057045 [Dreissena polymorpha]|uniref:Uncharacterized protein n=1 Tax=Dreissena polymorpha TaxID=45954 RepID=A0A9D4CSU1_DREPO|nr:hypothetical protein DPMN_057045 [Dreissena polymorpha]
MAHIKLMTKFVQLLTKFTDRHTDRQTNRQTDNAKTICRETDRRLFKNVLVGCTNAHVSSVSLQQLWLVEYYGYFAGEVTTLDTDLGRMERLRLKGLHLPCDLNADLTNRQSQKSIPPGIPAPEYSRAPPKRY